MEEVVVEALDRSSHSQTNQEPGVPALIALLDAEEVVAEETLLEVMEEVEEQDNQEALQPMAS